MKQRVGLPVLLILLLSLLATDRLFCTGESVRVLPEVSSEITQDDRSSDRYTDYNRPLVFPSESSVSFCRTPASTGATSVNACSRRSVNTHNIDKIMMKDGKLLKISDLSRFLVNILLFPSGQESMDHHLIILRKLII